MPIIGLGTWYTEGKDVESALNFAFKAGYKHIDTAPFYENEKEIGDAIKNLGVKREELFITTKLHNDDHGDPEKALEESLKKLQTDYVDLYLIHFPI